MEHKDVYQVILSSLDSEKTITPLDVANGYALDEIVETIQEILEKEQTRLKENRQFLRNYLKMVSFTMGALKAFFDNPQGSKVKIPTFSAEFSQTLLALLDYVNHSENSEP